MFSTTPSTGTSTRFHIAMAFSTSMIETSCGVVTMTAPVMGMSCDQRELRVAGAGRQVDDQVVELAPGDVLQELLEQLVHHRAAPDHRPAALDEEADRDDRHAVVDGGGDLFPLASAPAATSGSPIICGSEGP